MKKVFRERRKKWLDIFFPKKEFLKINDFSSPEASLAEELSRERKILIMKLYFTSRGFFSSL